MPHICVLIILFRKMFNSFSDFGKPAIFVNNPKIDTIIEDFGRLKA